jgi:bacterioferritin-associated ferredoxin
MKVPGLGPTGLLWELPKTVIVCICQRLSDRKIRDAVSQGARTCGAVFRDAGCAPRCGICLPVVKMIVAEGSRASAMGDLAAAD